MTSAESPAVEGRNFSVALGARTILRAMELQVEGGVVCGLLGANGSGKTTLLKTIAGQLPHSGSLRWHGQSTRGARVTSLCLQSTGYHEGRRVRDHLRFLVLTGLVERAVLDQLVEELDLACARDSKPSALSFGQRQSLNVLGTLAAPAQIYLLDEPFAGLDARRVAVVRDRIVKLRAGGATVVVTSHDLAPIEGILEQVVVLDDGHLHFSGRVEEFVRRDGSTVVAITCDKPALLADFLEGSGMRGSVVSVSGSTVSVRHSDYRGVIARALASGVDLRSLTVDASPLRSALANCLSAYRTPTLQEVAS